VALSLGLSNFTAAIGLGVAGVDVGTRLRVGLIFGVFEAGMPMLGLLLGHSGTCQSSLPGSRAGARPAAEPVLSRAG
jgi:hypothetical protein